ncbi:MAG: DUF502 domain-containing protein [Chloroflexota bacterium]|nr:DUF502 domain-containing protein [Chloroflexota bacterium]
MEEAPPSRFRRFRRTLENHFITGLLVFIPVFVTAWLLYWAFNTIDDILQPVVERIFGRHIEGIGFACTILLILVLGTAVSNFIGRRLFRYGEAMLARIPVVSQLYQGIKQIVDSFSPKGTSNFLEVVLLEFPRKGIYTPGLVTNRIVDESGKTLLNIYVPTAPNPTSGFLQIVPEDEITHTSMSVDDALKMVISAGKVSSEHIPNKLLMQRRMKESQNTNEEKGI